MKRSEFEINPIPMFGFPSGSWHKWFAWKPVRSYDNRFVWLRHVSRRRIQLKDYLNGSPDSWWQYSWEKRYV